MTWFFKNDPTNDRTCFRSDHTIGMAYLKMLRPMTWLIKTWSDQWQGLFQKCAHLWRGLFKNEPTNEVADLKMIRPMAWPVSEVSEVNLSDQWEGLFQKWSYRWGPSFQITWGSLEQVGRPYTLLTVGDSPYTDNMRFSIEKPIRHDVS